MAVATNERNRTHRGAAWRRGRVTAVPPPARRSTRACCICPARTSSTGWSRSTDRSNQVLRNLQSMYDHGRLGGTGYLSILPVDQGIEHSAGASFAPNPAYFDPEKIVELAYEGGCNAVASTIGVLGAVSRRWAHQHPVHRQAQPQRAADATRTTYDQTMFGSARPGVGDRRRRRRRDDLLRQRAEPPAARRGERGVRGGAPARDVHRALVLPAQLGVQAGRRRLQPCRRPDRPGEPSRRHDRGGHHQAEDARGEQRLRRAVERDGAKIRA